MRFLALFLASAAVTLAGCASTPQTSGGAAPGARVEGVALSSGVQQIAKQEGKVELAKDDRVRCEKYTPIGSHRTKYRCVTEAEHQAEAAENQQAMRKMAAPPPSSGASSIGN